VPAANHDGLALFPPVSLLGQLASSRRDASLTGHPLNVSICQAAMKVHLAYGRHGLDVELPDHAHVLLPERLPALPDPAAAVRQALRQPIASPPLQQMVRPGQRVAVVFSDITRPIPNHVLLPPLLAELEETGIHRQEITLINALGMHRPNTSEELERMLGREIVEGYRIVQHSAHDPTHLTYLFTNGRGARVEVNSHYMAADVRILTGFVEPHVFAGYSGGGKAVLPGIAGAEIVMSNHSGPMLAHPRATWCTVEENPSFQEIREVALTTRPTMLLNVTLSEGKEIAAVFAGGLVAAHNAGIAFAERAYMRPVPHEYDIAIASNLGYPADINLYQSFKGLSVAAQAVRSGGIVIVAAECSDGLGRSPFRQLLAIGKSLQEQLKIIEDPSFRHDDQWGVQVGAKVQAKVRSYLYSTLSAEDAALAHMIPCSDICGLVRSLSEEHRRTHSAEPRILVLPYGQLTVPRVVG